MTNPVTVDIGGLSSWVSKKVFSRRAWALVIPLALVATGKLPMTALEYIMPTAAIFVCSQTVLDLAETISRAWVEVKRAEVGLPEVPSQSKHPAAPPPATDAQEHKP